MYMSGGRADKDVGLARCYRPDARLLWRLVPARIGRGVVEMVYLERQGGIAFRQPDWRDVEEVEELPLGKKSAALVRQ